MRICDVMECEKKHLAKGYCRKHYDKIRSSGTLEYLIRFDGKTRERAIERAKIWRAKHPGSRRASDRVYRLNHKRQRSLYDRSRKQRLRAVTPKWADKNELDKIYASCPEGFHVDHIIPINGKDVTGLHVPWNLQYLPAEENVKKGNKFEAALLNSSGGGYLTNSTALRP